MPELSVIEVDPDQLFGQHTVSEIESVLQSLNNEIERRKVELRTLVGERYRDLIETADTISQMKSISEHFIKEVQTMNSDMGSLKFKTTPVFKTEQLKGKKRSFNCSLEDSIAAQISILVDIPELVWNAINSRDYVRASQLYLLGRHIKTGFSVDKSLSEVSDRFPVIEQQWSALSLFPKIILEAAESNLMSFEISSEDACNCLCSLALLDSGSLPEKFLSLRLDAINKCLESDRNVKSKIIESYNVAIKSLSILWDCFGTENYSKQLLWKRLPLVADKLSPPVVKLLERSIRLKYIPPIILQFRASSLYSSSSFDSNDLPSKITDWIRKVRNLITEKGKMSLNLIVSLPSLESLTNIQITSGREWDQLLSSFNISDKFDLWNDVYKPLISSRAKELISVHCDDAFKEVVQSLEGSWNDVNAFKPDTDLRWFVWKESPDDLDVDSTTKTRGLLSKAKGITPKIVAICAKFEKTFSLLHDDLSGLYSSDVTLQADQNDLKKHQQNAILKLLLRLKEYIRGMTLKETVTEAHLSITARFLLAVPDLCPTLQKCLTLSVDSKVAPWEDAKVLLETEGMSVWSCWETKAALRLEAIFPIHMRKPASYADLLNIIPQWETVWIEEGEEGNEKHKSQLRVPSAPSFPLQAVLHGLSTELAKSHLPRVISENLMQKLMMKLIQTYDASSPLCQAESLQYLFDLKYLLAQFIPITNKELSANCHEKITSLEGNIDPFDLDVFSPHIVANIKSSVHRTQLIFGSYGMIRSDEGGIGRQHKMPEDPCSLALSKSNAWFPLIPVTNPVSKPLHLVKPKAIKSSKTTPETSTFDTSKVLSSSFLSDWFG